MSDLVLYYWPGACSLAAHILLEETGLEFRAVKVDFASAMQGQPEFLAINPKGRVPALATSRGVLTENPAILAYLGRLAGAHDGMWPANPEDEARCAEWASWLASTVHVAFAHISRSERYADSAKARAEVAAKGVEACRPLWLDIERRLAGGGWAMGATYTVVDPYLQVFWNWGRGARLGYDMEADFPTWTEHARRLCSRPAVRRAFEREGIALP